MSQRYVGKHRPAASPSDRPSAARAGNGRSRAVATAAGIGTVALAAASVSLQAPAQAAAPAESAAAPVVTVEAGTTAAQRAELIAERAGQAVRASRAATRTDTTVSLSRAATSQVNKVAAAKLAEAAKSRAAMASKDPKAAARAMTSAAGWGASEFACLDKLWTKESNWKVRATNPSSGAYGIPQSLPASKMASAGSDWKTNPLTQIKWGLDYIEDRYGSPCRAWAHSQATNWY